MTHRIELPSIHERAGIFCAFLLLGHKMTFKSWNDLTGLQGANQRADDLRKLGLLLNAPRYEVSWSKRPVSVYQFNQAFINGLGTKRVIDYIEATNKVYANDERIKKGLQSKPQPLSAILSGQALNSEVTNK